MRREGAFTLVEVLVALAIFALIGAAGSQLLLNTLDAQNRAYERAERLTELQRALDLFEQDLRQHVTRPVRDEFDDLQAPLLLEPGPELELTRQGWSNPMALARSELLRVNWQLDGEGRWQRRFWLQLDRAPDTEPVTQQILDEVDDLRLYVVDEQGTLQQHWPLTPFEPASPTAPEADLEAEDPQALAIQLEMMVAPFGRIQRLIPLPRAMPPMDATPDQQQEQVPEGEAADGA